LRLADTLGPLPLLGFSLAKLFRADKPWRHDASLRRADNCVLSSAVLYSLEL